MIRGFIITLLLGLSTFQFGCVSLQGELPYAEVELPVVSRAGDLTWEVLSLKQTGTYLLTNDASARPPSFLPVNTATMGSASVLSTAAGYGIANGLDLGLSLGRASAVKMKYQFLGYSESQTETSWVGTLGTSISHNSIWRSGDQKSTFGPGGYPWKGQADTTGKSLGVTLGNYIRPKTLLYMGLSYNDLAFKGTIDQSASDDGLSSAAFYETNKSGRSTTVALGFRTLSDGDFNFAINYSHLHFDGFDQYNTYLTAGYLESFKNFGIRKQENIMELNKPTWQGKDFLAIPVGYMVGFGTGQAIQDRWRPTGRYFALADLAGLGVLLSGAKMSEGANSLVAGATILTVSRIWQIVDMIISASSSKTYVPAANPSAPSTTSTPGSK